ncbi:hypothetical protein [Pelosinus sp. IPA-1]|uniref:hypothetical protein n=1 Tax=Pelosinus sp. IPA-1 TaxID=3029569 RepID=UPI00243617EA|nr:hypothetical protein [Pelosinus sp. IPA-1]GMB00087.1 hypothetical protein PIPA1_28860 [Pelosinus sp. IPA-1]
MRVEVYEKLVANVEEFERQGVTLRSQREIVINEITEARNNVSAAVATEQTKEVLEAQARLVIAEEKLRKLPAVDSSPAVPKGAENAYGDVRAAVSTLIGQGAFIEEFQPLLDELAELRSKYISTLTAFFKKKDQVNTELGTIQRNAKVIQEQYTNGEVSSYSHYPPCLLTDDNFRRWIWIENDYHNEIFEIQDRLLKESRHIPPVKAMPNTVVLKERPLITQGQHSIYEKGIQISEPRVLGTAKAGRYSLIGGD